MIWQRKLKAASLFRAELRHHKADRFAELGCEPMSDDEINAEIAPASKERRRS
jgi:hypothetical protein